MLNLAMVDKLNRAGFVVAPYSTPEEQSSVKSVSGPARHVGEAGKCVRDSRGGSPCGENRCGIGEGREGERFFVRGSHALFFSFSFRFPGFSRSSQQFGDHYKS